MNNYFAKNLKYIRKKKNIDQQVMAEDLGVAQSTLSCWESGIRTPDLDMIVKITNYLNIKDDFITKDLTNINNVSTIKFDRDVVKVPVLGKIPAGMPFEAIEDEYTIDYEEIPRDWLKGGKEYFALKIDGDSMEPDFKDKDTVIFLKSPTCESGQYCCVKVNGYDATFKKVQIQENGILLSPLNLNNSTGYMPTFYTNEQIRNLPVEIIGVAKRYIGDL